MHARVAYRRKERDSGNPGSSKAIRTKRRRSDRIVPENAFEIRAVREALWCLTSSRNRGSSWERILVTHAARGIAPGGTLRSTSSTVTMVLPPSDRMGNNEGCTRSFWTGQEAAALRASLANCQFGLLHALRMVLPLRSSCSASDQFGFPLSIRTADRRCHTQIALAFQRNGLAYNVVLNPTLHRSRRPAHTCRGGRLVSAS